MRALNSAPASKHASWAYAEYHLDEDPVIVRARARGADLGVIPISQGVASTLEVLATTLNAGSIAEVGSGVGVSGVSLLRGSSNQATLTSIDYNPDCIGAARATFREENLNPSRTRMITGNALQVLPRMATAAYDAVLIDADLEHIGAYTEEATRMLRPGGLLLINNALDDDRLPRPAVREASTQAMRDAEAHIREDPRLRSTLINSGTGLLLAARTAKR